MNVSESIVLISPELKEMLIDFKGSQLISEAKLVLFNCIYFKINIITPYIINLKFFSVLFIYEFSTLDTFHTVFIHFKFYLLSPLHFFKFIPYLFTFS
jgi:hypothetical protein